MFGKIFEYTQGADPEILLVSERVVEDAIVREGTHLTPGGIRRAAYLVKPQEMGEGKHPAILYSHWYEPEAHNSNRTQFLDEAIQLAGQGVVSMLVETLWSDRDWFIKRSQEDDIPQCVQQVVELRQAADLLLKEPGVDPERFYYVGHDFGGMYGLLMGAVDQRPKGYVIMAATPRFSDWFLYYPPMESPLREEYIENFKPYDPITVVSQLAPAPVLFQFADTDPHVPETRAKAFFEAAGEPKELKWYQAGHGLNEVAAHDRIAWLIDQLNLK